MSERDTICALASGQPPAAICILRLSGDRVWKIAGALLECGLPEPRHATLTKFRDDDGRLVDEGLALFMPGPHSYTGEDTLELYLHGGPAVIKHSLDTLTRQPGVRLAEPGEFTRRAFEAGKLDLTEAEGVADIIEAETEAQKAQALRQLTGGLTETYDRWRAELTGVLALIEVMVDFPDEGDTPEDTVRPILDKLDLIITELEDALGDRGIGEKIRDGFRVAIVGPPNAGKSSLLNRIARREAAIVTDIAGTTRDVVEVRLVLGGQVVWLADTAGLRKTADIVEAEGVRRAERAAREADLRIHVIDGANPEPPAGPVEQQDIVVFNKADQRPAALASDGALPVSAATGEGIDKLESWIGSFISERAASVEAPVITRARHREKLSAGLASLVQARQLLEDDIGAELAAEDVRMALRQLGAVIGTVGVEDILGAVFSQFCIGK
ncbi:tRNA uridine-5-carboxymethylaminomethyl(34) synthesis GTPase MnmE [Hyphomonas sp.]|uniref:tRNA uridine-5-carboxymethylaminomethyl(34) synthesis GTPase MnmE n=1 Tax=Hyphomonas sp. TaxID=87 RepID=UPI000C4FE5F9|nr:tRNA uridine-5-carboxymethylaminomethyl(34) synthesis GTPase MnmE [Hyphomonas sp.]MAB10885.1 tRNA uridine-5-carboxymethylaminomethyl(34) synthesis GTPase MnmE [Hyphomonas sp.]MAU66599.1 tRNA uridine-5-carboxymethylaminomethyl(34) synthesis GTPase MnmE [Hyphomonas sp.]